MIPIFVPSRNPNQKPAISATNTTPAAVTKVMRRVIAFAMRRYSSDLDSYQFQTAGRAALDGNGGLAAVESTGN